MVNAFASEWWILLWPMNKNWIAKYVGVWFVISAMEVMFSPCLFIRQKDYSESDELVYVVSHWPCGRLHSLSPLVLIFFVLLVENLYAAVWIWVIWIYSVDIFFMHAWSKRMTPVLTLHRSVDWPQFCCLHWIQARKPTLILPSDNSNEGYSNKTTTS